MKYLFELGHQPHISIAELEAVLLFSKKNLKTLIKKDKETNYLILKTVNTIDTENLISKLGGTTKIGWQIKSVGDETKSIVSFLNQENTGKIHFSVANKKLGLSIKKELKAIGRSVRYIEPKNAATILHNNLVVRKGDFTIIDNEIFVTLAIQPFEEMSQRDFGRPGSDDFSGMLPPKLAKIMINLSQAKPKSIILDPFCGSGTILTEVLAMDYKNIIGSDISEKAVDDTEKNIKWLIQNYRLVSTNYKLLKTDASQIHQSLDSNSVDIIISEPYMGKPLRGNESKITLEKQTKELTKLYSESFKAFYKILKKDGVIVFIIPQFKNKDEWMTIDCIEEIEKIGFKIEPFGENESLLYHRPKQHVGRGIWRFKKQ